MEALELGIIAPGFPPPDVESPISTDSSGGDTLDIRIAAIFAILAASCIGGLPPLFVKVRRP